MLMPTKGVPVSDLAAHSASWCESLFWGSDPEMHVVCYIYTSFDPGGNGLGT